MISGLGAWQLGTRRKTGVQEPFLIQKGIVLSLRPFLYAGSTCEGFAEKLGSLNWWHSYRLARFEDTIVNLVFLVRTSTGWKQSLGFPEELPMASTVCFVMYNMRLQSYQAMSIPQTVHITHILHTHHCPVRWMVLMLPVDRIISPRCAWPMWDMPKHISPPWMRLRKTCENWGLTSFHGIDWEIGMSSPCYACTFRHTGDVGLACIDGELD